MRLATLREYIKTNRLNLYTFFTRLTLGVFWLSQAAWKNPPYFGQFSGDGYFGWVNNLLYYPFVTFYTTLYVKITSSDIVFFGWFFFSLEFLLGILLLFGVWVEKLLRVSFVYTLITLPLIINVPSESVWVYIFVMLISLNPFVCMNQDKKLSIEYWIRKFTKK